MINRRRLGETILQELDRRNINFCVLSQEDREKVVTDILKGFRFVNMPEE